MPNGDVCLAAPTSLSPVGCARGGVPAKIIEGMVATSSAPLLPPPHSLPFFLSPIRGKWNQGDGDRLPFCRQGFVEGREAARPRHRKIICRRSGDAVRPFVDRCLLRGPFHVNMSTVTVPNALASSLLWEAFLITAHTTWGVKILRN